MVDTGTNERERAVSAPLARELPDTIAGIRRPDAGDPQTLAAVHDILKRNGRGVQR